MKQLRVDAFMARDAGRVSRPLIDTGAAGSLTGPATSLGSKQPADALIAGATADAQVTATEVGSLTAACGPADAGAHLPCDRMYVVKPLPPGLMLFSYGELRKKG